MAVISPANFTVSGSGFTPSGALSIELLLSNGNEGIAWSTTASSTGTLSVSLSSTGIETLAPSLTSPGTYTGVIWVYDSTTQAYSNQIGVSLVISSAPTISVSPTAFTAVA